MLYNGLNFMFPGFKIMFQELTIRFRGLNIILQSLIEFLGMQILLAILTKLKIILLIRELERNLIGGIIRLREWICRRGTGVMMGGRTIEGLIGSSHNCQRGHHHQRHGESLNSQNHHLLMVLACTMEKQLQLLSLRKHFLDQSQIQN